MKNKEIINGNINFIKYELGDFCRNLDFQFRASVDSTNKLLKKWADKNRINSPFLLLAGEQTAGRGRRKRRWYSPEGEGLYFSLFLSPKVKAENLYMYTIISSLAVQEVLEELDYKAKIKWPNDIMLSGSKVAGILSELITVSRNGREKKKVIVGIGINTHMSCFPDDLRTKATSLLLEAEASPATTSLFIDVIKRLIKYHQRLNKKKEIEKLRKSWVENLNIKGKVIKVFRDSDTFWGVVKDVSPRGKLILSTGKGEKIITAGDVEIAAEEKL